MANLEREALIEKFGSLTKAAEALGIARSTLTRKLDREGSIEVEDDKTTIKTREVDGEFMELVCTSPRIKTVEEAIAHGEVDLEKWKEIRSEVTSWECPMKLGSKEEGFQPAVVPLWRVHVKFERLKPDYLDETVDNLIIWDTERRPAHEIETPHYPTVLPHALEISLFDSHFGKLCWGQECGIEYNTNLASDLYVQAVEDLLDFTKSYEVERIVYPIGQDFFNVNNWLGETQRGTKQDVDTRFQRIFEIGCQSVIQGIELSLTRAPVDVIWVPGNHDWETSWYMTKVLDAWFRDNDNVKIDRSPAGRKYFHYGVNLVGYTHGDKESHNMLPGLMATEQPAAYTEATDKRWHLGHFHKEQEKTFLGKSTVDGSDVVVEILPSLSAADSWHYHKGYINGRRSAMAYLYSKSYGLVGDFYAYARL